VYCGRWSPAKSKRDIRGIGRGTGARGKCQQGKSNGESTKSTTHEKATKYVSQGGAKKKESSRKGAGRPAHRRQTKEGGVFASIGGSWELRG